MQNAIDNFVRLALRQLFLFRCTDLIDEMAQMNAEFKKRGEKLSAMEVEISAKVTVVATVEVI